MIPKHAPGPWTSRRHPGQGFEILDAENNPVMRQRGGLVPTVPDAQLMTQAAALADCLRNVQANLTGRDCFAERVADSLRRIAIELDKIDGEADRS